MANNPWMPFKPVPQYRVRVPFLTALKTKITEKWDVLAHKWRWKYYSIVYQTDNVHEIRRAMATEQAQKLYNMRAPVRAVQKKLLEGVLYGLQSDVQQVIGRGTIEYNGWKELPNSLNSVLWLSWTPNVGSRIYRICAPSMAVLVRDRFDHEENYDPYFADKIYKIPDGKHFVINPGIRGERQLTPERERAIIAETLIALATAIQVEEDARAKAL
jgi:hypothetical protein